MMKHTRHVSCCQQKLCTWCKMLNQRIKQLRESLNMTQEEFAANLSMSGRSVQRWEAGLQSIQETSLRMIELIFNVNPEWLRDGKGEMFTSELIPEAEKLVDWLKSLTKDKQDKAIKDIERHMPALSKWLAESES